MTFKIAKTEIIYDAFTNEEEKEYKTSNKSLYYCPYRKSLYSYGYYEIAHNENDIIQIYKRKKSNTTSKQISGLINYCKENGHNYIIYEWRQKGKREFKQYIEETKAELLKMTAEDTANEIIKYLSNTPEFIDDNGNEPEIVDIHFLE